MANSVDPDQMPHSAASDLGLHCLPMSLLWDARHKWVNFHVCLFQLTNEIFGFIYGLWSDQSTEFLQLASQHNENMMIVIDRAILSLRSK